MSLYDSKKKVVAVKHDGNVTSDDVVYNTEGTQVQPSMKTGSYQSFDGGQGSKSTWRNSDQVTCEGVTVKSYIEANDTTGVALDTLPSWSEVFKTCALEETVDTSTPGSEFIVYSPLATALSNASQVAVWTDGNKDLISGIVGNYKVNGVVGEPIMQEVAYTGYTALVPTVDSNPSGASVPSETLIILKSTDTVTIDGVSYRVQSFDFDQGNKIENFYALGLKQYDKVDFEAVLNVTMFREDNVLIEAFQTGERVPVVINAGSVNGKSFQFTASQAEIEEASRGTSQDKETLTIKFSLQPSSGIAYDHYEMRYGFIA